MEDAAHSNLDGLIVDIDGFGLCGPRAGRRGRAAASRGLIALFWRTISAVIARRPVGRVSQRHVRPMR